MFKIQTRLLNKMLNLCISVDGNISSGKSTLVKKLFEGFPHVEGLTADLDVIPEPLDKWRNAGGHNLLAKFYEDPVRNNFLFQHYVQLTRLVDTVKQLKPLKSLSEVTNTNCDFRVRLIERSLQNTRHCFIELARKTGKLSDQEYSVLLEWHDWLDNHLDLSLDLIIYLRTTPQIVHDRMRSRGRDEESTVSLKYLEDLHCAYEDWLLPVETVMKQNVIVINADEGADCVYSKAKLELANYLAEVTSNIRSPSETNF